MLAERRAKSDDVTAERPRRAPHARCRRTSCGCSTPTGAPRTTSPSGRSTCSTTRSCASRCKPSTSSRGCSATSARRRASTCVYAHLNRAIRARDLDAIFVTGPGHGGPGARRERVPRGHLQRALPGRRPRTRTGCGGCSGSSRSPAASRATPRPRRPARSTRAASSATRSRTPSAPPSTTPTCSSRASSATARPRPGRSRRAGTRTSSSTRAPTAPSCRSST